MDASRHELLCLLPGGLRHPRLAGWTRAAAAVHHTSHPDGGVACKQTVTHPPWRCNMHSCPNRACRVAPWSMAAAAGAATLHREVGQQGRNLMPLSQARAPIAPRLALWRPANSMSGPFVARWHAARSGAAQATPQLGS